MPAVPVPFFMPAFHTVFGVTVSLIMISPEETVLVSLEIVTPPTIL